MAKKPKFSLKMENEIEVRTIKELKDNFSIPKVIGYFKDGRLEKWLRNRFETDIADSVGKLDLHDEDLPKRLCELFDVSYDKEKKKIQSKLKEEFFIDLLKLLEFKSEDYDKAFCERFNILYNKEVINAMRNNCRFNDIKSNEAFINSVALSQDELCDLINEGLKTIYLFGKSFLIPLEKEGISYIGINQPTVVINSDVLVDWKEKNIFLGNIVFDSKYQVIIDRAKYEFEVLNYLDNNYKLISKKICEFNGKFLFFEHETSSILYMIEYITKKVEMIKNLYEQDIHSQWVLDWLIYKDKIFYISSYSQEEQYNFYIQSYDLISGSIRCIKSLGNVEYHWPLKIVDGDLEYVYMNYGSDYINTEIIKFTEHINNTVDL